VLGRSTHSGSHAVYGPCPDRTASQEKCFLFHSAHWLHTIICDALACRFDCVEVVQVRVQNWIGIQCMLHTFVVSSVHRLAGPHQDVAERATQSFVFSHSCPPGKRVLSAGGSTLVSVSTMVRISQLLNSTSKSDRAAAGKPAAKAERVCRMMPACATTAILLSGLH